MSTLIRPLALQSRTTMYRRLSQCFTLKRAQVMTPQPAFRLISSSATPPLQPQSLASSWRNVSFWRCRHTWRRAGVNTLRCLIGCSIGDLSLVWYLMSFHPQMDMAISMALSMTAGISTSIMLETALLHLGKDRMPLTAAARTACLSDNNMTLASKEFWLVTCVSMTAGYLVPLPYNYIRLKLWGKACH
ncbi:hypothetical protein I312_103669 [Cryptococcus bacillisporus CA1280]|uniref:uncharacterized protein n=1 Tax=Cryptococcus bacillisporus CA1280 TaxID=1296109 RepID=UPI003368A459